MSILGDAGPMDARLDQAPIVARFAQAVRSVTDFLAFYAGGSLAMGDFRPGTSDLDLAAVMGSPLDAKARERLRELHETTQRDEPSAAKLHCVYLPFDDIADRRILHQPDMASLRTPHLTWAHGELYRRPFTAVARAELLQAGIIVFGPPPSELFPPIDRAVLEAAARAELSGYWSGAVRKPWLWFHDVYVDLGLLTLARVEATLADGRLITKREALTRLDRFGVGEGLVREIAARRDGEDIALTPIQRARRAAIARRLVSRGIRALT
jgi:hypothetical protein